MCVCVGGGAGGRAAVWGSQTIVAGVGGWGSQEAAGHAEWLQVAWTCEKWPAPQSHTPAFPRVLPLNRRYVSLSVSDPLSFMAFSYSSSHLTALRRASSHSQQPCFPNTFPSLFLSLAAALGLAATRHPVRGGPEEVSRKGISCERTFKPMSAWAELEAMVGAWGELEAMVGAWGVCGGYGRGYARGRGGGPVGVCV